MEGLSVFMNKQTNKAKRTKKEKAINFKLPNCHGIQYGNGQS
jgi:hypothetical protein